MKQETLATMTGFERYAKKTRRAVFLEEMEQVVPWRELCALVEPYYPRAGNGRPPVGVERMLRIYFLQQWFNLSDLAVEETLYEPAVTRQFVGVDPGREPVPDETTVCKFRHLLEEHDLGGQMLEAVNQHLHQQGVRISTGTIVDATIIHAPASTENANRERDLEMHQPSKGQRVVLRHEVPRGGGQQDQASPHGGGLRGPCGRRRRAAQAVARAETRVWGTTAIRPPTRPA
jgi:transposase, IS5 family